MIDALTASPLAWAAARAPVAFVWQGALIGAVTALALLLLRRRSANARYLVACTGLVVLCATPLATGFQYFDSTVVDAQVLATSAVISNADATATTSIAPLQPSIATSATTTISDAIVWLNTQLPALLLVWAAGVCVLALRLGRGWITVARIRNSGQPIADGRVTAAATRIAERLGINRSYRLLTSARVVVPSVIGWIKPAILLPAGVLAGMPASHLEAVLAHELAHIRRADFLVNVLQCTAEVLLFYHPAVWWVSRQIRIERELCADDLAVAVSGDRVAYASALASLESIRAESLAVAMVSGDDLLTRVRRMIEPDVTPRPRISGGFAMTVAMTLLLLALTGAPTGTSAANVPTAARIGTAIVAALPGPVPASPAPLVPKPATKAVPPPASPRMQAPQARLTGVVRDSHGGVIPGATVTITVPQGSQLATPMANRAVTNARGAFTFQGLEAGVYELTTSISGFRTNRTRLQIAAGVPQSVIITVELGSLTEHVTVNSGTGTGTSLPKPRLQTPADLFDLAKSYYQQGRLVEAEDMTARAIALMRAETPAASTAPLQEPTGPVRVGGDVTEPRKTRHVNPIYPAIAVSAAIEGTVIIEATIGTDGTVKNARVLRTMPMLDESALAAVRQWVYTPTKLNGQPVEVVMTVSVSFVR